MSGIKSCWLPAVVALAPSLAPAQSNIDPDHPFAWGENVGWTNWSDADGGDAGVLVGATFLSGYIWAGNLGWINVGDGSPDDGVYYANLTGLDFGVNVNTNGDLFGLAWGESVGWMNFEGGALAAPPQPARIRCDGQFEGFVWAENGGWINLSGVARFVVVETDCNSNGVPDECDVSGATSADVDGNGIPDECGCPLIFDLNGSCFVDSVDLGLFAACWRCSEGDACWEPNMCADKDFNCSDIVDNIDLDLLAGAWLKWGSEIDPATYPPCRACVGIVVCP